ncbi:MAG: periplasmic protein TonB [Rhodocyclaceae bacterium]|nr:MAG: periplasmic protein TonB [Rhodocyclaceae bacterium]TND02040.1 MAG: periplasmic protein TonB [Rhodocyclaceae bacterium]
MIAPTPRWPGVVFVMLLHAAALWALWQHRLLAAPVAIEALFVHFIAPPTPPKAEQPRPQPPKAQRMEKPQPQQLVAETPVTATMDPIAPPPRQESVPEAPRMPPASGPLALGSELALACPERAPPAYPTTSRRLGETGVVVLRVELDEQGLVASARIDTTSTFERLDQAALTAVRSWRCNPPRRDGQPVRAVARQPFHFVLQGS